MLLTSSDQIWQMNLLQPMDPPYKSRDALDTSTQNLADEPMLADGTPNVAEQRCLHTATDISWSRMAISHCYWYLVVKNGNFTLLLMSSGQEWQFHIATDILWFKQMNLLQPMDPHTRAKMPWISVHKTWQMNLLQPMDPPYKSRDALNTSTQNLADEPMLALWDPQCSRAEMPFTCYWHFMVQEWQFHIATDI